MSNYEIKNLAVKLLIASTLSLSGCGGVGTGNPFGPLNPLDLVPDGALYMRFDEPQWNGAQADILDSSGNGNHGVANGNVTPSQGLFSGSANLGYSGGMADYILVQTNSSLNNLPKASISMWVNIRSFNFGSAFPRFIEKSDNRTGVAGWRFYTDEFARIRFSAGYSNNLLQRHTRAGILPSNTWVFITMTWDGTNRGNSVHFYINGEEISASQYGHTADGVGPRVDDSNHNMVIGNQIETSRPFDGLMDELIVWRRGLAPEEIRALYQYYRVQFEGQTVP